MVSWPREMSNQKPTLPNLDLYTVRASCVKALGILVRVTEQYLT